MSDAPSLFEAEALGILERATSHARATDAALAEGVNALEWRGAHRAALGAITARIGDATLMERVGRFREG